MTQDKMPTRTIMPCPFAGGEGAALATIGQTSGDTVNFQQGFPSVYGAPASLGGKYVKRSEINAIGNLATNDLFYSKCGGLNTFDQAFCTAIGGYPRGAILDYIDNSTFSLFKIMSLKDNNTTVPNKNSIDAITWTYLNVPGASPSHDNTIAKFTLSSVSGMHGTNNVIGIFRSELSGYVTIYDTGGDDSYKISTNTDASGYHGIGILGNTFSENDIDNIAFPTYKEINNFKWLSGLSISVPNSEYLYSDYPVKPDSSTLTTGWNLFQSVLHVNAGDFVAFAFICGSTRIGGYVAENTISNHEITVSVV